MENDLKVEIVDPQEIIYSDNCEMVTIPSFEGEMGILKDHISIITFLRPGIIKVLKNDNTNENFFVENGIVEFSKNNLVILSSSVVKTNKITKEYLESLQSLTLEKFKNETISDQERYILNHKLDVLKNITLS